MKVTWLTQAGLLFENERITVLVDPYLSDSGEKEQRRIPVDESNLSRRVDSLPVADVDVEVRVEFEDLLFYFAIALVSLMFVEWLLQIKKNF